MVATCFLFCDALEMPACDPTVVEWLWRKSRQHFRKGTARNAQLIPNTLKYTYNFYNFIKNLFGVICLYVNMFINNVIKKKNYEKKKKAKELSVGSSNILISHLTWDHAEFLRITSMKTYNFYWIILIPCSTI